MKSSRSGEFSSSGVTISVITVLGLFPIFVTAFCVIDLYTDIFIKPAYAEKKNTSTTTRLPRTHTQSSDKNAEAVRQLLRTNGNEDGTQQTDAGDQSGGAQSDVQKAAELIKGHKAAD